MNSTIGIIGVSAIGQALARQAVRAGYEVVLSNSRGPDSLTQLVREIGPGARSGQVRDATAADIVAIAVPWKHLRVAVADLLPWEGRIVIDTTNPIITPGFKLADLGGKTSSEVVASLVPGARLVKAANTLPPPVLAADPRQGGGRRVLFMSGDDVAAKVDVAQVFDRMGFATVDLGSLAIGGQMQQFPGSPLPTLNLIKLS
ncbi:MAG: NADPH-dependent F420 reductase [Gammaproteobacteria bacterium]